ncbi:MAG: hypothetical protein OEU98_02965, partial [Actinomycetota bacterium]|nr:hypothetical protein [Actinomycetota bacterium]
MRQSTTAVVALAVGMFVGSAGIAAAGSGTTAGICVSTNNGKVRVADTCKANEYPLVIEGAQG